VSMLKLSAIPVMKTKEVLFYPVFPNYRKSIAIWKVPRHRPFILLVRTTLRLIRVRSIGGMIIDRVKPQYSEETAARYHFVHHKISYKLTWDRIRAFEDNRSVTNCQSHDTTIEDSTYCTLYQLPGRTSQRTNSISTKKTSRFMPLE